MGQHTLGHATVEYRSVQSSTISTIGVNNVIYFGVLGSFVAVFKGSLHISVVSFCLSCNNMLVTLCVTNIILCNVVVIAQLI